MRAPAGFHVANALIEHVVLGGTAIACRACGHEGRLPFPGDASYSAVIEEYIERHRLCQAANPGVGTMLPGPERGAA